MSDLIIPDVSEFQGAINWSQLGAKCPAVIIRAHNGYRVDYRFSANIIGARINCKWRGFYQYLPADVDPRAAARAFAATVTLQQGEVAIIDHEEGAGDQRARHAAWLDELHAANEWDYSGLYFARTHLPGVSLDWIAAYQNTEPTDAHKLWQFTSSYTSFPGIAGKVDASSFHGTINDLIALTKGTGIFMALTDAQQQDMYNDIQALRALLPQQYYLVDPDTGAAKAVPAGTAGAQVAFTANMLHVNVVRQDIWKVAALVQKVLDATPAGGQIDVQALAKAIVDEEARRLTPPPPGV